MKLLVKIKKTHFNHSPLLFISQCAKPDFSFNTFQTYLFFPTILNKLTTHLLHLLLHLCIRVAFFPPAPPRASIMYIKNMASVITWKHNVTDLRHWAPSTTVGVFCRSTHKSNTGRVKEQKYVWLAPLLSENTRGT